MFLHSQHISGFIVIIAGQLEQMGQSNIVKRTKAKTGQFYQSSGCLADSEKKAAKAFEYSFELIHRQIQARPFFAYCGVLEKAKEVIATIG